MRIETDRVVTVAYTLSNEKGEVLDTSEGREPLTYIQGAGMIKGFEAALEGKSPQDAFSFTVKPEEGYGERRPELLFQVDKAMLREIPELAVGVPLRVRTPDGAMVAMVAGIEDDKVTLDGNHPLAGLTLTFDVEVSMCVRRPRRTRGGEAAGDVRVRRLAAGDAAGAAAHAKKGATRPLN